MSDKVIELNSSNFDSTIASGKAVLVDFWAPWCAPCRMLSPTIDKIADEVAGKAIVAKVNVDECPEIAAKFGISQIPTIIFFSKGQLASMSGPSTKDTLKNTLLSL